MQTPSAETPKEGVAVSDKEFRGWWLMHLARQPSVVNLALVGVGIIYCKETLVCAHAILLLIGRSRLCTSVRHLAGAGIDSFQTQDGNPISSCHESALCARVQNGMPSVALPQRPAAAALKRAHRTTAEAHPRSAPCSRQPRHRHTCKARREAQTL